MKCGIPSECASARAPSTASGEQQALAPSVSGSAQSLTVTPTTSAPRSRSSRAATALSTPPRHRHRDALAGSGSGRKRAATRLPALASARCSASVASWAAWRLAGVRPPIAASTASTSIARRLEHRRPVDQLGDGGGRGEGRPASLRIEADRGDPLRPRRRSEIRDRSPQAAPPAAPLKAPSAAGPRRLRVAQVVLEKLPLHAYRVGGGAPTRSSPAQISRDRGRFVMQLSPGNPHRPPALLPGGCGPVADRPRRPGRCGEPLGRRARR